MVLTPKEQDNTLKLGKDFKPDSFLYANNTHLNKALTPKQQMEMVRNLIIYALRNHIYSNETEDEFAENIVTLKNPDTTSDGNLLIYVAHPDQALPLPERKGLRCWQNVANEAYKDWRHVII